MIKRRESFQILHEQKNVWETYDLCHNSDTKVEVTTSGLDDIGFHEFKERINLTFIGYMFACMNKWFNEIKSNMHISKVELSIGTKSGENDKYLCISGNVIGEDSSTIALGPSPIISIRNLGIVLGNDPNILYKLIFTEFISRALDKSCIPTIISSDINTELIYSKIKNFNSDFDFGDTSPMVINPSTAVGGFACFKTAYDIKSMIIFNLDFIIPSIFNSMEEYAKSNEGLWKSLDKDMISSIVDALKITKEDHHNEYGNSTSDIRIEFSGAITYARTVVPEFKFNYRVDMNMSIGSFIFIISSAIANIILPPKVDRSHFLERFTFFAKLFYNYMPE